MYRNIVMFPHRFGQPLYGVDKTPSLLRLFFSKQNNYYNVKCNSNVNNNLLNLYTQVNKISEKKIVIGGDHSMSIATVADTLNRNPNAKVIWIDAHADINTPDSSISKNLHGMPLAFLTGLTSQKELLNYTFIKTQLQFNNLLYIGLRDIDPFEEQIILEKNISVISVNELENDFHGSIAKIEDFISDSEVHVSFDVDSLDPTVIPCTGTTSENGIRLNTARDLMNILARKKIINMDITELNLELGDKNQKMESLYNLFFILNKFID